MLPFSDHSAALRGMGADDQRLLEIEQALSDAPPGSLAGRVSRVDRGQFQLLTPVGSYSVDTSGVAPVGVGDWCIVGGAEVTPTPGSSLELQHLLERRTSLVRQSSGNRTERQVLATNVDTVMVVIPFDLEFSPRRAERFLALAWDSGAPPVIVLTKADLISDESTASVLQEVDAIRAEAPVIICSTVTGAGMPELQALVTLGRTVALIGTSGSGKSSLVNSLSGAQVVKTGAVRAADAKGRHTTTWRELIVVPSGGTLIDTPGLRELGMWIDEEGIESAFTDISELAPQCRFNDCAHQSEPGCAVLAAIASGDLDPIRLESYRKLLGEAADASGKHDYRMAKHQQKIGKKRIQADKDRDRPLDTR
jgi:ribosome biogenesis GTPase